MQFDLPPCRYEARDVSGTALTTLLNAIRDTRTNGSVLVGRFRALDGADPDDWFSTGSFVHADTSVRDLLTSDAVRDSMPELRVPDPYPLAAPPRFSGGRGRTLTLDGELALVLVLGGAYGSFPGTAAEAKRMATDAVHDLVGDRHEDFAVYECHRAWSPYFYDVAWDSTWLLADHRHLEVTLLATTDTD